MKKINTLVSSLILTATILSLTACGGDDNSILPVKKGDYWGYVTPKGKYVVNPMFDQASYLNEGMARVVKDGKVGYINYKGKFVISPSFDQGTDFSEGKAFVVKEGEAPVCIDKTGKTVFVAEDWIDQIDTYSDGVSLASSDTLIAFLDSRGRQLFSQKGVACDYHDNIALSASISGEDIAIEYLDNKGNRLFAVDYEKTMPVDAGRDKSSDCYEGLILMRGNNMKYGYLNKKGEIAIDFQFDDAYSFNEGLACVKVGKSFGFINQKGQYVINPQFSEARSFHNGLAAIQQGKSWGFVDKTGKIVINPAYSAVSDFIGDNAFMWNENQKAGIINKNGKVVVDPQFDDYLIFRNQTKRTAYSMKYTGHQFIPAFLSRYENGSWDGMNASTTLGEIRAKYKNAKAKEDECFVSEASVDPIDDIVLTEVEFHFDGKTYKVVDKIVQGWFFAYKAGKQRQYINSRKLAVISYKFSLKRNAAPKAYSIASSLAEELATVLGADVEDKEEGVINLKQKEDTVASIVWSRQAEGMTVIIACQDPNAN